MTHYPQTNPTHRATRIQLATTPAVVKLSDGQKTKGNIHLVSITGGLLQLARALSEGDFVEVAFQTNSGNVQGMAEMLNPVRRGQGSVLQAFRFVALDDEDHHTLSRVVEATSDRSFLGLRSSQFASPRT